MEEIVCTGCYLLCDDSTIEVKDGSLRSLGLCRLGHAHLESAIEHATPKAFVRTDGKSNEIAIDDAIQQAADILLEGGSPLLIGWSQTSDEVIKEGLDMAARVKGFFDSMSSLGTSQAMRHEMHSLKLEADLEYVRNHGEFIIYWGTDPSESLHRHPSRFAVLPRGEKIPEGVESRTLGVVDVRQTETMKIANHRFIIPIGSDAELLETLAADITGTSKIDSDVLGIPATEVIGFSQRFQKSDCTAIFYGSGILNSGKHADNLAGIQKLVEAIRSIGKEAFAFPMFTEPNSMGVIKHVADVTSVPCSIDYSSGTGVHNSDVTALQKLVQGEHSTSLVVGDDVLAALPRPAAMALAKTRIIYIGTPNAICDRFAEISIHTPDQMLESGTTMERIDMVTVTLKGLTPPVGSKPTILEVITKLNAAIHDRGGVK